MITEENIRAARAFMALFLAGALVVLLAGIYGAVDPAPSWSSYFSQIPPAMQGEAISLHQYFRLSYAIQVGVGVFFSGLFILIGLDPEKFLK